MEISTRNLNRLPEAEALRKTCKAIAMLDAILEPEWEYRYYSYNAHWGKNEELASMRDGEGSFFFILFDRNGVIIKGYDEDSVFGQYNRENHKPWPGVIDGVPSEFHHFLQEPAFYVGEFTFCIWQMHDDLGWQKGNISFPKNPDPDGSERLLQLLDGAPETYQAWAEVYHEVLLPAEAVEHIYSNESLTLTLVQSLSPSMTLNNIESDVKEIGYPMTS